MPPTLTSLTQLPPGCRLLIYGAGDMGTYLLGRLRQERPDVQVLGLVDTFRTGEVEGYPVQRLPGALKAHPDYDLVIVATHVWADEVVAILEAAGVTRLILNGVVFRDIWRYFGGGWEDAYTPHLPALGALWEGERDRALWNALLRCLTERSFSPVEAWAAAWPRLEDLDLLPLQPGDTAVEGGVYDGTGAAGLLARVSPGGRVFGFDPLGTEVLAAWGRTGRLPADRVEVVPMALWSREAELTLHRQDSATHVEEASAEGCERIPATSLDAFSRSRRLDRLDLLALDVEGAELEALEGARECLARFRPCLAISLYHDVTHFFEIPLRLSSALSRYRFHLNTTSTVLRDVTLLAIPEERAEGAKP